MGRRFHFEDPFEGEDEAELNLVPYLDIITSLVLFLIFTFQVVIEFRLIELLPPAYGGARNTGQAPQQTVQVTVAVFKGGYKIFANVDAVAPSDIPLNASGKHDTEKLHEMLKTWKEALTPLGVGNSCILMATDEIEYSLVVETMDAMRMDGKNFLFPDVLLARASTGG